MSWWYTAGSMNLSIYVTDIFNSVSKICLPMKPNFLAVLIALQVKDGHIKFYVQVAPESADKTSTFEKFKRLLRLNPSLD